MRSYLIDELQPPDIEKIITFLNENATQSNFDRLYWVRIPEDLLSGIQFEHRDCQPHAFAIEVGKDWVKLEFFVRSMKTMQCTCPGYCTRQQQRYVINFALQMLGQLDITT